MHGEPASHLRSGLLMDNLAQRTWNQSASNAAKNAVRREHACEQVLFDGDDRNAAAQPNRIPLMWVLHNKCKVALGKICFDQCIDCSNVAPTPRIQRSSFLNEGNSPADARNGSRYPLKDLMNNLQITRRLR